jgi:hypothetical protein
MDLASAEHLVKLRVHLSTTTLLWIQEFVRDERGVDALGDVLSGVVANGSGSFKARNRLEMEAKALLEVIKCLRVLITTEVRNKYAYSALPVRLGLCPFLAGFQPNPVVAHPHYTHRVCAPRLFAETVHPGGEASHYHM